MNKKKKNKKEKLLNAITFGDIADIACDDNGNVTTGCISYDYSLSDFTYTTNVTSSATFNTSGALYVDNYQGTTVWVDELGDIKEEQRQDKKLREENPSLQEAWDEYQLIKRLVQEEESDKYMEDKYKGFKE